jgi:hypothetical protein
VNVELCPYTAADDRAVDKPVSAFASSCSAEETDSRSEATFATALVTLCCAEETACTSLAHGPELDPLGDEPPGMLSPLGEELSADALSAALSPAQSTDSFARDAATVAW